ncbi:type IVB secretion system protein IcmN/DotK [Legionella dresdenensis]|uniref:Type IVB secretion system protein IcmN/DotK n=1 Tax=Legionella dresdenensis TaxID=450200 RepID=A0ABV8CEA9_9GAMM
MQRLSTWPATLLLLLLLTGCQGPSYVPAEEENFRLPSRVAGSSDKKVIAMQAAFSKCGVKVITIGQDYLISIPSAALFADQSPRLTWQSFAVLNQVAEFMQQFRKVGVNVTAYSSKYVSSKREQALTLARARAVSDYLWSQGIDSRFIFTEGAGSDKPISANVSGGDREINSRIEITFRDAIV